MLANLGTRGQILLLILACVLPAAALSLYTAFGQRVAAERQARAELVQHAQLIATLVRELRPESATRAGPAVLGPGQTVSIVDLHGRVINQYPAGAAGPGVAFPDPLVREATVKGAEGLTVR